jgi:hypothetical protein
LVFSGPFLIFIILGEVGDVFLVEDPVEVVKEEVQVAVVDLVQLTRLGDKVILLEVALPLEHHSGAWCTC